MKKLITIFFIMVALAGYSQKQYIPWLQTDDHIILNNLILNGDSVKITSPANGHILQRVNGKWVNVSNSASVFDSLRFEPNTGNLVAYKDGSGFSTVNIDGRYVVDSSAVLRAGDSLLYVTTFQFEETINEITSMKESIYSIKLPSSNTVGGRIAAAVSGTDYPEDWVLTEGNFAVDLKVTHNLGQRVASVTVFAVTGTQERQLFGNVAYSGIYTENENVLVIESLATIQRQIVIYIVFK